MVPPSILDEKPLVVAGRAEGAVGHIHRGENFVLRTARILDSKPPGTIAGTAGHVQVTAKLDHEIVETALPQHLIGAVDGVAFADSAQVGDHALAAKKRGAGLLIENHIAII